MCTVDFLRDILSGRKLMKKLPQVRFVIGSERYSDLTLASLLRYAEENLRELENYIPSNVQPNKLCREYVLNVRYLVIT